MIWATSTTKEPAWNPALIEARSADRRTKCGAAAQPFNPFVPDKVSTMCPEYTFRILARDVQDARVPRRPWMAASGPGENRTPDRPVRIQPSAPPQPSVFATLFRSSPGNNLGDLSGQRLISLANTADYYPDSELKLIRHCRSLDRCTPSLKRLSTLTRQLGF